MILYTFLPNETIDALLDDRARAEDLARRMVKRAEQSIPGLADKVVIMETSATRTRMFYTANGKGALGWSPDPATLPRMPDHESSISGLLLCGQWTRTGGGINNVFASAQLAATRALDATWYRRQSKRKARGDIHA